MVKEPLTVGLFMVEQPHGRVGAQPFGAEMLTIAQTTQARLRKIVRMLLFFIVCVVFATLWVVASALRLRARVIPVNLGWMSERWLMEYRTSQSQ